MRQPPKKQKNQWRISDLTCITLIGKPVSLANCSLMCLVGFGVCEKAFFNISNCLALIVVLGPLLLDPEFPSSGDLFSVCESLVSGSPSSEPGEKKSAHLIFPPLPYRNRTGMMINHQPWSSESSCVVLLSQLSNGVITSLVRELLLASGVLDPWWWWELVFNSSSSSSSEPEQRRESVKSEKLPI